MLQKAGILELLHLLVLDEICYLLKVIDMKNLNLKQWHILTIIIFGVDQRM